MFILAAFESSNRARRAIFCEINFTKIFMKLIPRKNLPWIQYFYFSLLIRSIHFQHWIFTKMDQELKIIMANTKNDHSNLMICEILCSNIWHLTRKSFEIHKISISLTWKITTSYTFFIGFKNEFKTLLYL